jgi:hypothetical protein
MISLVTDVSRGETIFVRSSTACSEYRVSPLASCSESEVVRVAVWVRDLEPGELEMLVQEQRAEDAGQRIE